VPAGGAHAPVNFYGTSARSVFWQLARPSYTSLRRAGRVMNCGMRRQRLYYRRTSERSAGECNRVQVMRCSACGAELVLSSVVPDDTVAVRGVEHLRSSALGAMSQS
jgi:hypothetical protein